MTNQEAEQFLASIENFFNPVDVEAILEALPSKDGKLCRNLQRNGSLINIIEDCFLKAQELGYDPDDVMAVIQEMEL